MIILKVTCDNMYMFKDFEVDFTYVRRINHALAENDTLFPESKIKVRKNIVLMGGNASGKTTFGKLLCFICNYIYRGKVDGNSFALESIPYDKGATSNFSLEFAIGKTVYLLEVEFKGKQLIREVLRKCIITKSTNRNNMRKTLYNSMPVEEHVITGKAYDIFGNSLESFFFSMAGGEEYLDIKQGINFLFRMSQVRMESTPCPALDDVKMLNEVIPKIDDSVQSVDYMYVQNRKSLSYQITFKNGDSLVVPDGDITRCEDRLSHGTFEVIEFLTVLAHIQDVKNRITYVDEKLAHMHSELEAYLTRKMFWAKPCDSQIFITTHNIELFQLNIPINTFIFFKRNDKGFNEAIFPSDFMNKNDRNLSSYYLNDYFGVLPDYSVLDRFFEATMSQEEN